MTAGDIKLHADGASGGAAHQEDILPFAEYISWENVTFFPLCENGSLSSGTQENTDIQHLRNMTFPSCGDNFLLPAGSMQRLQATFTPGNELFCFATWRYCLMYT